jgi:hypothetical protein
LLEEICDALIQAGATVVAEHFLLKAAALFEGNEDLAHESFMASDIAPICKAFGKAGLLEPAMDLIGRAKASECPMFEALVEGLAKRGDLASALKFVVDRGQEYVSYDSPYSSRCICKLAASMTSWLPLMHLGKLAHASIATMKMLFARSRACARMQALLRKLSR